MSNPDLSREHVAKTVLEAIENEHLSQRQAAVSLNICQTYISFLCNKKDIDKIPKAPWDRIVAWVISGKTLADFMAPDTHEAHHMEPDKKERKKPGPKQKVVAEPVPAQLGQVQLVAKVLNAVRSSGATQAKAAKALGIPGYVISILKNQKNWDHVSKAYWEKLQAWHISGQPIIPQPVDSKSESVEMVEHPVTPDEAEPPQGTSKILPDAPEQGGMLLDMDEMKVHGVPEPVIFNRIKEAMSDQPLVRVPGTIRIHPDSIKELVDAIAAKFRHISIEIKFSTPYQY